MNVDGKWTYNRTEDGYWNNNHYDSRDEAIAAGRKHWPARLFHVGQCESIEIPEEADAEKMIERISEVIDDNYGGDLDFGESFYNEAMEHHDELQESLEKVVKEWLDKHKFCEGCFVVRNVEMMSNHGNSEGKIVVN